MIGEEVIIIRLNPDCIRDILLALNEKMIPDENGCVEPIDNILAIDSISNYSQNEILYTVRHLFDDDILKKGKTYINEPLPRISDITPKGHRLIEEISSNSKWNKIKEALMSIGQITATAILNAALSKMIK